VARHLISDFTVSAGDHVRFYRDAACAQHMIVYSAGVGGFGNGGWVTADGGGLVTGWWTDDGPAAAWARVENLLTVPGSPIPLTLDAGANPTAAVAATDISTWQPYAVYPKDRVVYNPAGDLVRCTTAHVGSSSYDATKWAAAGNGTYAPLASSTAVGSVSGAFTPGMNGKYFYLRGAGPAQVTGTNAWENAPLFGTFSYVSATAGTLSVAATVTVTGKMLVGADATAAINSALATGECRLPSGASFMIAGQIASSADGQALRGEGLWFQSRLFSVTARGNGPIFAMHNDVVAESFSWWGNGQGDQPANIQPANSAAVVAALANAGCGVTFAAVHGGLMQNVRAFHCGGNGTGSGVNGIAGLYSTMGCQDSVFHDLYAKWCRNGFNEDSFLGDGNPSVYAPQRNMYARIKAYYCRFGVAWETGQNSLDLHASDVLGYGCTQTGIEIHDTYGLHIEGPRGENNGLYGINVYGNSSVLNAHENELISPIAYGNTSHGIRFGDNAHDNLCLGGNAARNGSSGLAFSNVAHDNKVLDLHLRLNSQGATPTAEVIFNNSSNNVVRVKMDPNATGWLHTYAVVEQNSSGANTLLEDSNLIAGTAGLFGYISGAPGTILPGVALTTKVGSITRRERSRLSALGMKGETFSRYRVAAGFGFPTGDMRAVLVGLCAGDQIIAVYAGMTQANASISLVKMGVWSIAGTLLASTADVSANFTSGSGIRGGALTAPWVAPADGGYYVGMVLTGTGSPTLLRDQSSGLSNFPAAAFNGGAPEAISASAQSDIGNFASVAGSSTAPWFCWT
jgi:hypothetical protein